MALQNDSALWSSPMVWVMAVLESETVVSNCRIAGVANPDPAVRSSGTAHDKAL